MPDTPDNTIATSLAAPASAVPLTNESMEQPRPKRVFQDMPVDIRSLSLAMLAVLGSVFMLHWASAVFIPLMLGLTFSYALNPVVGWLQRRHIPRAMGAALLLLAMVGGAGWTAYVLSDDATQFLNSLPETAQKIRQATRANRNQPETAMSKVQKAATQLEQAAKESSSSPSTAARGVTRVQIEKPQFNLNDYLLSSTPGVLAAIGQATIVLFITFFQLASGDSFRRKLVKLAGPTLASKKITVQALDKITEQIQRYLLVQVFISVIVGVATWLAYSVLGVEHAAVWGVLACVFNFIPYIGSLVITGGSALFGFVQFGSVDMALLLAGVSLAVHTISGNLLTPWLTSRTSQMNPVVVFVGVLAFGWLWGVWGLLLGMPILLMIKVVCDHIDGFKPLGELLGK
ncbi:MAG: AI-2E family transporter [Gammaproteobacteria bacterium]|nr:AI-2E family transporter [Gammaproteobacteria bacterium]MBU0787845.1 AI-2E family transporter [Gammaproteobacteria bacterium]MBU0817037.1 AI-2E family transporter [Gammaproteobacteria bacterium]MBU1787201.1 AI-2E family transporter [Gammaproteobacteria bacterium]